MTWTDTLIEIPDDATLEGPYGWALRSGADLNRLDIVATTGTADSAFTAEQTVAMRDRSRRTTAQRKVVLVTPDHPTVVVAQAWVRLPLLDNTNTADCGVVVHPDLRRRGLGSKLARWCEQVASQAGRTTLGASLRVGPNDDSPQRIEAPAGGSIPADHPSWLFASRRGWSLEQIVRKSVLDLPMSRDAHAMSLAMRPSHELLTNHFDPAVGVENGPFPHELLTGQAGPAVEREDGPSSDEYEVEVWDGDLPQRWLPQLVVAKQAMSTDQPLGGIDYDAEVWDEQRLIDQVESQRDMGRRRVMAVAIHRPTGQLAAYTEIDYTPGETPYAFQNDTLALRAHRGRGLGLRVKLANIEALTRINPGTHRVYTWNAEENTHMLAINVAMGFRPAGASAEVQKKTDAS